MLFFSQGVLFALVLLVSPGATSAEQLLCHQPHRQVSSTSSLQAWLLLLHDSWGAALLGLSLAAAILPLVFLLTAPVDSRNQACLGWVLLCPPCAARRPPGDDDTTPVTSQEMLLHFLGWVNLRASSQPLQPLWSLQVSCQWPAQVLVTSQSQQ